MSVITPTFVSPETNAESASLDGAAAAAEVGEEEEDIQCVPCDPCEEYGIRVAKFKRGPKEPTKDEICEHYKTHIPYRSWCPRCVAACTKRFLIGRAKVQKTMPLQVLRSINGSRATRE